MKGREVGCVQCQLGTAAEQVDNGREKVPAEQAGNGREKAQFVVKGRVHSQAAHSLVEQAG